MTQVEERLYLDYEHAYKIYAETTGDFNMYLNELKWQVIKPHFNRGVKFIYIRVWHYEEIVPQFTDSY